MLIDSPIPTVMERNNFYSAALGGDKAAILRYLETFGTKYINVSDATGWTALHYATLRAQHGTMIILLENGASPHIAATDGRTPLDIATHQTRNLETVAVLTEWEAQQQERAAQKRQEALIQKRHDVLKTMPRSNPFRKITP